MMLNKHPISILIWLNAIVQIAHGQPFDTRFVQYHLPQTNNTDTTSPLSTTIIQDTPSTSTGGHTPPISEEDVSSPPSQPQINNNNIPLNSQIDIPTGITQSNPVTTTSHITPTLTSTQTHLSNDNTFINTIINNNNNNNNNNNDALAETDANTNIDINSIVWATSTVVTPHFTNTKTESDNVPLFRDHLKVSHDTNTYTKNIIDTTIEQNSASDVFIPELASTTSYHQDTNAYPVASTTQTSYHQYGDVYPVASTTQTSYHQDRDAFPISSTTQTSYHQDRDAYPLSSDVPTTAYSLPIMDMPYGPNDGSIYTKTEHRHILSADTVASVTPMPTHGVDINNVIEVIDTVVTFSNSYAGFNQFPQYDTTTTSSSPIDPNTMPPTIPSSDPKAPTIQDTDADLRADRKSDSDPTVDQNGNFDPNDNDIYVTDGGSDPGLVMNILSTSTQIISTPANTITDTTPQVSQEVPTSQIVQASQTAERPQVSQTTQLPQASQTIQTPQASQTIQIPQVTQASQVTEGQNINNNIPEELPSSSILSPPKTMSESPVPVSNVALAISSQTIEDNQSVIDQYEQGSSTHNPVVSTVADNINNQASVKSNGNLNGNSFTFDKQTETSNTVSTHNIITSVKNSDSHSKTGQVNANKISNGKKSVSSTTGKTIKTKSGNTKDKGAVRSTTVGSQIDATRSQQSNSQGKSKSATNIISTKTDSTRPHPNKNSHSENNPVSESETSKSNTRRVPSSSHHPKNIDEGGRRITGTPVKGSLTQTMTPTFDNNESNTKWLPNSIQYASEAATTASVNSESIHTLPAVITPSKIIEDSPDCELITIGFQYKLHFSFLVETPLTAAQLFTFLPYTLSYPFTVGSVSKFSNTNSLASHKTTTLYNSGPSLERRDENEDTYLTQSDTLQISISGITNTLDSSTITASEYAELKFDAASIKVKQIVPYMKPGSHYITSVAEVYVPKDYVSILQDLISDPDSLIYKNPTETFRSIADLIDPSISITSLSKDHTEEDNHDPVTQNLDDTPASKYGRNSDNDDFASYMLIGANPESNDSGGIDFYLSSKFKINHTIRDRLLIFIFCLTTAVFVWIYSFLKIWKLFYKAEKEQSSLPQFDDDKMLDHYQVNPYTYTHPTNPRQLDHHESLVESSGDSSNQTIMEKKFRTESYDTFRFDDNISTVYGSERNMHYIVDKDGNFYYSRKNMEGELTDEDESEVDENTFKMTLPVSSFTQTDVADSFWSGIEHPSSRISSDYSDIISSTISADDSNGSELSAKEIRDEDSTLNNTRTSTSAHIASDLYLKIDDVDAEEENDDDENVADLFVGEFDALDEELYKRLSVIVQKKNAEHD